jgi:hypothetical protein
VGESPWKFESSRPHHSSWKYLPPYSGRYHRRRRYSAPASCLRYAIPLAFGGFFERECLAPWCDQAHARHVEAGDARDGRELACRGGRTSVPPATVGRRPVHAIRRLPSRFSAPSVGNKDPDPEARLFPSLVNQCLWELPRPARSAQWLAVSCWLRRARYSCMTLGTLSITNRAIACSSSSDCRSAVSALP